MKRRTLKQLQQHHSPHLHASNAQEITTAGAAQGQNLQQARKNSHWHRCV
jgi:hypothetical protein